MPKHFILVSVSVFISLIVTAQPVIRMQNGNIPTCEMFIVDSDSLQGNYVGGVRTITITSANNTRLAFNMEVFLSRNDDDNMAIFDGTNITAPLLTTITATFGSGVWYAVSTGNSITLRFTASFLQTHPGSFRSKIRCITDPAVLSLFQPVKNALGSGSIQIADYDKDNDKDILLGGQVYRNDSYTDSLYMFERIPDVMNNWSSVRFVSADFDNDGDKDVFITGTSNVTGSFGATASLYTNNGSGVFTRVASQPFAGAYNGACEVVDFNNDGRPDICYTGRTNVVGTPSLLFKIYLNNGSLSFTDAGVSLTGLPGLINSTMSWADCEGDGDNDLVIQGHDGTNTYSRLYLKTGNTLNSQTVQLTNTSAGRIVWADVNKDGKPDIVNTGVRTAGNIDAIVPEILFNNGNNSFTRVITNLPALPSGTHDWNDYDNDNDMDVVLCGMKPDLSTDAAVYKNNGNGNFTKININATSGHSTVKWMDFNKDGKQDIFITGKWNNYSYFLKNMGLDSFKISSFPIASYDPSGNTLIDDFTGDGLVDALFVGNIDDVDCFGDYTSILIKSIGWRSTPVINFTKVADLRNSNPNSTPSVYYSPYWKWGDFDSDGNLDIILTNDLNGDFGPEYIVMFRNMGNNNFQIGYNSSVTPLPGITSANKRQIGIFDIDNDGKNELFVTPHSVYKWVNNAWVMMYEDQFPCSVDCWPYYVDFADIDRDGFIDAAMNLKGTIKILRNNKAGRLVMQQQDFGATRRQIKWFDFDKDGDQDLLTKNAIIENRNGQLVGVNNGINDFAHAAVGDFNQDGLPDIVSLTNTSSTLPADIYLNMQRTLFFKYVSAGKLIDYMFLPWQESAESFDMDNDGDDDIIHTANGNCTTSVILANLYNITNRNIHVRTPNGGDTLRQGTTQTIQWMGTQIGPNVKIELSRDSMQSWEIISAASGSAATVGSFQWTVSGPASNKCFVRITDNSNNSFVDYSDAAFSISIATAVNSPDRSIPLKIFPNPTTESLHIQSGNNTNIIGEAVIFNVQGSQLSRTSLRIIPGQTQNIKVSNLMPGIYFMRIQSGKKVETVKFIKL
jgi:hypothetical protein